MKITQIRVDGYKNLINAELNLGDFNVLVGPNNSGKSNFLKATQLLWPICFGDQESRKQVFSSPRSYFPQRSPICHLDAYANRPISIGFTFEHKINDELWIVDYSVIIQCSIGEEDSNAGFVSESLRAKETGKTGRLTTYFQREKQNDKQVLKIKEYGKDRPTSHTIAHTVPTFQAIESLYPDFAGLPPELELFTRLLRWTAFTSRFALSPTGLRSNINTNLALGGLDVNTFDICLALDTIKEKTEHYELFSEAMCTILDLEDVDFYAFNWPPPEKNKDLQVKPTRIRQFYVKRHGSEPAFIEEFSDGTFTVAAILIALLTDWVRGPMLCLEELENCLHPAAVSRLLSFLQDYSDKWQTLITTHSPSVLNSVKPEDVNVCVANKDGATHFEKVKNTAQLRDYLNKSMMSFGDLMISNFEEVLGDKE